ncbi:hypothetical protein GGD50_004806 [Rhizobium paranaense]|uniref:Uncharacterized protein n=1 Tax=Rhizobium paranaense TaxID=1650438 RepID=A0A7W9D3R2_9HYPH|nr:hypothetical protein [Rhizobium paranaense]
MIDGIKAQAIFSVIERIAPLSLATATTTTSISSIPAAIATLVGR